MSLILDALRKSEAERQRGKSPGLFATTPGVQREIFPRMKLWPVLVFLAFLMASAWVIWRGESRRAESERAASTVVAAQTDSGVEVVDPAEREPPATRPSTLRPSGPSANAPPVQTARASPIDAKPSLATASASPPTMAVQPATAAALPASPPPSAATPDQAPEQPLPTVAILDAGTRASLPPLKLSMHVYGNDPSKRFAIVDGNRVGPGSLLGSGVVEEIRRDGVVIIVKDQRLLVPKP